MAAYDYSTTAYGGGQAFAATTTGKTVAFRIPINVATVCTGLGISAFTAADTLKIWDIPADFHMQGIRVEVKTACTTASTQTINIGDAIGTGQDYWITSALTIKTVADTSSILYNTTIVGGNIYTATAHLIVLFNGAAADGIFDVVVWGTDTNAPDIG
jgi:hypothetical protein